MRILLLKQGYILLTAADLVDDFLLYFSSLRERNITLVSLLLLLIVLFFHPLTRWWVLLPPIRRRHGVIRNCVSLYYRRATKYTGMYIDEYTYFWLFIIYIYSFILQIFCFIWYMYPQDYIYLCIYIYI